MQVMQEFCLGKSLNAGPQHRTRTFDGPQIPWRERKFRPQPPTQLEVSMHMQQLLLQHITEDRQEKEHLASELNVLHSHTRLLHLIAGENKKRLWKLLRKFFIEKKLTNTDIKEIYDYIDQGFKVEDF